MDEFKIGDRAVVENTIEFYEMAYPKGYAIVSGISSVGLHKRIMLKFSNGSEREYLNMYVKKYDKHNLCAVCGRAPGDIIHNGLAKGCYHHMFARKVQCAVCGEEFAENCEHNHVIDCIELPSSLGNGIKIRNKHQHDSQIKRLANAAYARSIAEKFGEFDEVYPKPKGHAITLTGSIKHISEEDIHEMSKRLVGSSLPDFYTKFHRGSLDPKGGNSMLKNSDSILNSELSEEQKLLAEVLDQNENLNMNDVRVQKALMKTTEFRKNLIEILKTDKETKAAKKLAGL